MSCHPLENSVAKSDEVGCRKASADQEAYTLLSLRCMVL